MEKKVIYALTAAVVAVTAGFLMWLFFVPQLHYTALARQAVLEQGVVDTQSVLALLHPTDPYVVLAQDGSEALHSIRFELPPDVDADKIRIASDYHTRVVTVTIPGIGETYFYDYPMIGRSDNIAELTYGSESDVGFIEITLDGIYELDTSMDDRYVYLDFLDPHEVYDHVVVVDAGHGGSDVGANREELGIYEKDLTLFVTERLKEIFDASDRDDIGVYYTRLDDGNVSLEDRVSMANGLNADLFLSIHINSTASGRVSGIHGTEVMYRVSDDTGKSLAFSQNCLDALLSELKSLSKGTVAGDEIYIVRTSEVPVALVEIGFITNNDELELMRSDEYQDKAARALYDAVLTTLAQFEAD